MSDTDNEFRRGYEAFAKTASSHTAVNSAVQSTEWVTQVEREIEKMQKDFEQFKGSNKGIAFLRGDTAEFWHAHTFNVNAIHNGSKHRAFIPRSNKPASADITTNFGKRFSLKYYGQDRSSINAQTVFSGSGKAKYARQSIVIPNDQIKRAPQIYDQKIEWAKRHSPARVRALKSAKARTSGVVTDSNGNKSYELSNRSSFKLAREVRRKGEIDAENWHLTPTQLANFQEILSHSLKAGMSAATISLVLSTTPAVIEAIQQLITSGELDIEQLKATGVTGVKSSGKGFVSGFITASITESARIGFLGKAIKDAIDINPSAIGAVAVIASNALSYSLKAASGEMTLREVADNVTRDVIVTSASLAAGGFTYSAIAGIVGQSTLPIPIFGYLVGSFVGSAIAGLGYTAGKQVLLGLCVEHGLTLFGLVDQDYELPENELTELGIDVAEFDKFELPEPVFDQAEFDEFSFDKFEPERIELTVLRRGLIGVSKVGYVS